MIASFLGFSLVMALSPTYLYDSFGLCHVRHVCCYEVVVTMLGAKLPAAFHHLSQDVFPASRDKETGSQSGVVIGQLLPDPCRCPGHQDTFATDALCEVQMYGL